MVTRLVSWISVLLLALLFIFTCSSKSTFAIASNVVINEVLYNPFSVDSGLEWIKLYNPTDNDINLQGFQLNANSGDYYSFGSVIVSSRSSITVRWATDGQDSSSELYTGKNGYENMGNTSGWVALFQSSTHNKDTIIDYIEYGSAGKTWESTAVSAGIWQEGSFIPNITEGNSIKLKIDGEDNNLLSDWQEYAFPTPSSAPTNTPTPTNSPTPTEVPTPTKIPTPTKTPTPTKSPTPTKVPTGTPISINTFKKLNNVLAANTAVNGDVKSASDSSPREDTVTINGTQDANLLPTAVLAEGTISLDNQTQTNRDQPSDKITIFGIARNSLISIFLGLGGIFILVCGILLVLKYKNKFTMTENSDL